MTPEELKIRLRRTLTNKFSTTIEPRLRGIVREKAFNNEAFCNAVDKAVVELESITESARAEYADKQTQQESERELRREAKRKR